MRNALRCLESREVGGCFPNMAVRRLHRWFSLGVVLGLSAVFACSGSSSGPAKQEQEPDAMLTNPDDVQSLGDESDGSATYVTWMRFGNLVRSLGPVTVCVRAPGAATSAVFFEGDGGATPDASDGASVEAPSDAGADVQKEASLDATPRDGAPAESSSRDSAREGRAPEGGVPVDADPADTDPPDVDAGAMAEGLAPLRLTSYHKLEGAGTFKLAVLPACTNCCAGAVPNLAVTLDSDQYTTVVLAPPTPGTASSLDSFDDGGGPAPFNLLIFSDESGDNSSSVRTRFINAVAAVAPVTLSEGGTGDGGREGGSVDGGPGADAEAGVRDSGTEAVAPFPSGTLSSVAVQEPSTAALIVLAGPTAPEQASTQSHASPVVDALGYHPGFALSGPLAFRLTEPNAPSWTGIPRELGLSAGSVHTGFVVTGSVASQSQFQVLWCDDAPSSALDGFSSCQLIGQ